MMNEPTSRDNVSAVTNSTPSVGEALSIPVSVYVTGNSIAAALIVIGNVLVISAFVKFRFLRTPANKFVAALAVMDLTMALSPTMQNIKILVPRAHQWGWFCHVSHILYVRSGLSSVLGLFAIAATRYFATFMPFKAHLMTPERLNKIVAAVVLYPLVIATTTWMTFNTWSPGLLCRFNEIYPPWLLLFYISHIYVLFGLIAFIYLRILREALRHQRAIAALQVSQSSEQQTESHKHRDNIHMLKNFSIIVGLFALAWIPYGINMAVALFSAEMSTRTFTIHLILSICCMSNSFINPMVYALRFKKFKRAFKIMLQCNNGNEDNNDTDE